MDKCTPLIAGIRAALRREFVDVYTRRAEVLDRGDVSGGGGGGGDGGGDGNVLEKPVMSKSTFMTYLETNKARCKLDEKRQKSMASTGMDANELAGSVTMSALTRGLGGG